MSSFYFVRQICDNSSPHSSYAQMHRMPDTYTNRETHNRAHGSCNAKSVLTSLRRGDIRHLLRGVLHRVMCNIGVNATHLHLTFVTLTLTARVSTLHTSRYIYTIKTDKPRFSCIIFAHNFLRILCN